MRKFVLTLAVALSAAAFANKADAAPLGSGLGQAADGLSAVEQVQYFYGGRNYCWYPDGWRGPGFYWCGYATRVGLGWGGPIGWRGWHHGGRRVGIEHVGRAGVARVGPGRVGVGRVGGGRVGGGHRGGPRR
jgi:hypothetical protein